MPIPFWRFALQAWFSSISQLLLRRRAIVVAIFLLLSVLALLFIRGHAAVNIDTKDLLSRDLGWRKLDLQHEALFPQYTDTILIVIESNSFDQSTDAASKLYRILVQDKGRFKAVYRPESLPFFRQSGLLFLDTEALYDLSDQLAMAQSFLGQLASDPSLNGLFEVLSTVIRELKAGENDMLFSLLDAINRSLDALLSGRFEPVSWHRLISGGMDDKRYFREFILLQPYLDYSSLLPAEAPIKDIQSLIRRINLEQEYGVSVQLSGDVVLSHEELRSVSNANWLAIFCAIVLLALLLRAGLGAVSLVCACLLTLLCGLVLTTAFAFATVGSLNLISVAFAILYIGLGIDFSIHYTLRYKESLAVGDPRRALIQTSRAMLRPLLLCTLSTSIGFFAFISTDYVGVAELGWIAGCGMFINLLLTLVLLPSLLSYTKVRGPRTARYRFPFIVYLQTMPYRKAWLLLGGAILLFPLILFFYPNIVFDSKTLNLQDPSSAAVKVYKNLQADPADTSWALVTLVKDQAVAERLVTRLEALDSVEKVIWLNSFIPADQDEKLVVIEEMNVLLGGLVANQPDLSRTEAAQRLSLHAFYQTLKDASLTSEAWHHLQDNLSQIILHIEHHGMTIATLERALLGAFPGRITQFTESLYAEPVTVDRLPETLRSRWLSHGHYQLAIYPAHDPNDDENLRRFISDTRRITPDIIGRPIIELEAAATVSQAFQQAFMYALLMIGILLLLLLRSLKDTVFILFALLVGAVLTIGLMLIVGMPMNFANIIALPLLLGIGVDGGIHILERYRNDPQGRKNILASGTVSAVILSALTTILSIGSLAFSAHYGTASMSLLLIFGICAMTFSMLFILPSLLIKWDVRHSSLI